MAATHKDERLGTSGRPKGASPRAVTRWAKELGYNVKATLAIIDNFEAAVLEELRR